jgi:hypothetical protein
MYAYSPLPIRLQGQHNFSMVKRNLSTSPAIIVWNTSKAKALSKQRLSAHVHDDVKMVGWIETFTRSPRLNPVASLAHCSLIPLPGWIEQADSFRGKLHRFRSSSPVRRTRPFIPFGSTPRCLLSRVYLLSDLDFTMPFIAV